MKSILEDIAAGDSTGVARCLDEYGGLVWTLADRYLRGQRQEVEDAVQDVFVNIWLAAPKYDPSKGAEASYIATIAHRRLLDHRRRLMSQRALAQRATARADAPAQLAEDHRARLGEEFSRLPDDEQTAVWLSVTRGLSHREIAKATSSPIARSNLVAWPGSGVQSAPGRLRAQTPPHPPSLRETHTICRIPVAHARNPG